MKHVSPGPVRLRVLASTLLKPLRRLRKKYLSTYHNPVLDRVAGHAARLRRLTLRRTTFIGITGSCGKTTTTMLTGAILSAKGACHVKASGNTHYATTRSMLSVAHSTRFCVHEVGAHTPGSIARAVKILRPQIGIVTNIGTDHYRQFRSLEATAHEKAALVTALPPSGTVILNADDPHVRGMTSRTRARVVTYGLSSDADIKSTEVSSRWPERLALTVAYGSRRVRIQTQLVGEHWATSVLAAIACGIVCRVGLDDCAEAVENFEPVFGRYSVHSKPGTPAYVLDTRKAPAWTLAHNLALVQHAHAPRKTIVFGTLSDAPGGWTSPRYRRLARQALEVADRVVFVGPQAGHVDKLREGAIKQRLFSFPTVYQASQFLAGDAHEDELILIKASITDHLERIMLHRLDHVACWRQRCGRHMDCPECSLYHTPQPPPFGLAHDETQAGLLKVAQPTSLMGSEPC